MKLTITKILCAAFVLFVACSAFAQQLTLPQQVVAGNPFSISTSGSGDATLYIAGEGQVLKRNVHLGDQVQIAADELNSAGYYLATLCASGCGESTGFYVLPGDVASLNFMARPSRLPVGLKDGISGTVYAFDKLHNLVTTPQEVTFQLAASNGPGTTRTVRSQDGVAWVQLNSAAKEGSARFSASTGGISVERVVQQVASNPCNLRMKATRAPGGVLLETDPIRDCNGNPVPDGTIVTFTETNGDIVSTVDAPIKRDIARAELPDNNPATFSVAAGIVLGNEIHWGGGR